MVNIVGDFFYECLAGVGMARAGLGDQWLCLFANDFDREKAATYTLNWGADNLLPAYPRYSSSDRGAARKGVGMRLPCPTFQRHYLSPKSA